MREPLRGWCERHGLLLCVALACLARFPALSTPPLSVDETWTWYVTAEIRRTGDFWRTTALGVDAPLFVAINALVARGAGLSVLGVRAPPALFGALSGFPGGSDLQASESMFLRDFTEKMARKRQHVASALAQRRKCDAQKI